MWSCPTCTFKNSPLLPKCEVCEKPKAPWPAWRATRESTTSKRKRLEEQNLEKARNIEIEAKRRKNAVREDRLRRSEGEIRCNHGKAKIQKQGIIVNPKTEEGRLMYKIQLGDQGNDTSEKGNGGNVQNKPQGV
jgi:hypothetical protein